LAVERLELRRSRMSTEARLQVWRQLFEGREPGSMKGPWSLQWLANHNEACAIARYFRWIAERRG
jgi:hypothetical protein